MGSPGVLGGAATLVDFAADATALSAAAFEARHGRAFLLRYGGFDSLKSGVGMRATLSPDDDSTPGAATVRADFLVFPIRSIRGLGQRAPVSTGRTATNDIVIDDVSITQLHAVFSHAGDGTIVIQDAGSKNGTFVNDVAVPRSGEGEPVTLRLGDRVRLGSVDMTFLPVTEFRALVQRSC